MNRREQAKSNLIAKLVELHECGESTWYVTLVEEYGRDARLGAAEIVRIGLLRRKGIRLDYWGRVEP